ncbi:MAG: hypothetical protein KA735_00450 [Burkholderiaceae bacterium]|nr:hypothetical protein [Burkholderiaceae bacterium]
MKRTDLEKNAALKLIERMKKGGVTGKFSGAAATAATDRRQQRKLDQEKGLVAFPVKLTQPLIDQLRDLAQTQNADINDVVADLLNAALKK